MKQQCYHSAECHEFAWARRESYENFKEELDLAFIFNRNHTYAAYAEMKWDFFATYNCGGEL